MGWTARVRFPTGQRFFLLHSIQTGSVDHSASYPMGTRCSFPRGKAAAAKSWPLTSIQCQGQVWWSYTSTPKDVFMAWCLINEAQRQVHRFYINIIDTNCWILILWIHIHYILLQVYLLSNTITILRASRRVNRVYQLWIQSSRLGSHDIPCFEKGHNHSSPLIFSSL
jgi:hypothetical protein